MSADCLIITPRKTKKQKLKEIKDENQIKQLYEKLKTHKQINNEFVLYGKQQKKKENEEDEEEQEGEKESDKVRYKINYDIEDIKNRYVYPFNNQLMNCICMYRFQNKL